MYQIYTDGACRGNGKAENVGGWGFAVFSTETQEFIKQSFGGEKNTTNNRMELIAAIEAVKHVRGNTKKRSTLNTEEYQMFTDSTYVFKGLTEWMNGWIRKDWKDVKNVDLWKELVALNAREFNWSWVKAHNGDFGNEFADQLANQGCDRALKSTDQVKDRFTTAMNAIYNMELEEATQLFERYSRTLPDYHSTSSRIYVEILENA